LRRPTLRGAACAELAVASSLDQQILPATYAPELVVIVQPVPMLAELQERLPSSAEWRYEPKLDGFRGLLGHDTGCTARLLSRNGRDLGLSTCWRA